MKRLLTPQEMWERDRGDEIKIIDYPLDSTSQVIELGGFTGVWSKKLLISLIQFNYCRTNYAIC